MFVCGPVMNPKNPVTWFLQSSLSHTDACAALPTPSPTRFARSLHRGCCRPRGTETAETGTLEFSGAAWRRYPWGWFRSVRGGQAVRVVGYGEGAREEMNLLVSLRMDGPTLTLSVLGPVELQQDGRVKAKPRPVLRQECVTLVVCLNQVGIII